MKPSKLFFTFMLAMLMVLPAHATFQYGGVSALGKNGIIREYNSTTAIAYYEEGGVGCFVKVSPSQLTVYPLQLPAGVYIKDFCIANERVYFCGTQNGIGILGDCHVDKILVYDPNAKILNMHKVTDIKVFTRIAIKLLNGVPAMAAIGQSAGSSFPNAENYGCDVLVFAEEYWPCIMNGTLSKVPATNDIYWDVTTMGDYFVTTSESNNYSDLVLRKYMIYGNATFFQTQTLDVYTVGTASCIMSGRNRAARIDDDRISVVSLYNQQYGIFGTLINTVNIQAGSLISSQYIPLPSKTDPLDMVYLKNSHRLILSEFIPKDSSVTNNPNNDIDKLCLIQLNPFTNAIYIAPSYSSVSTTRNFTSLTAVDDTYYAASAGKEWIYSDLTPPATCMTPHDIKVTPLSTLSVTHSTENADGNNITVVMGSIFCYFSTETINTYCL